MRTIRTKVYQFNELNDEAKQVAIENYRNNNHEVEFDAFRESCIEQAIDTGFEYISLQYSLGYSQGDGLSFGAKNCTIIEKLILEVLGTGKEKTANLLSENIYFSLHANNGHYTYASKSDIDFYFDFPTTLQNTDNLDKLAEKVLDKLQTIYMDLCKKLEKQGYSEIEYQNSDEYISENLISNEYEFTKEGNIF